MSPRAGLDGRKISSPPGIDPGQSSPSSVADLPNLQFIYITNLLGVPQNFLRFRNGPVFKSRKPVRKFCYNNGLTVQSLSCYIMSDIYFV